jgi:hypothetical protein
MVFLLLLSTKYNFMKAHFIKLNALEETHDGTVMINADNISSIRRIDYNDTVQTMILMVGGERFGVHQLPEEIVELVHQAEESYA